MSFILLFSKFVCLIRLLEIEWPSLSVACLWCPSDQYLNDVRFERGNRTLLWGNCVIFAFLKDFSENGRAKFMKFANFRWLSHFELSDSTASASKMQFSKIRLKFGQQNSISSLIFDEFHTPNSLKPIDC